MVSRFQSTPPHGGRRAFEVPEVRDLRFQSTPPHGGRLNQIHLVVALDTFQSTPPHGGRRNKEGYLDLIDGVSIHAPAWRATAGTFTSFTLSAFQSTPPHGGRLEALNKLVFPIKFQSTPPHGGRLPAGLGYSRIYTFQSTPPHGGRLQRCARPAAGRRFNPRPRMEGDPSHKNACYVSWVSIHAPAWRATGSPLRA